jgi:hypothetical protein
VGGIVAGVIMLRNGGAKARGALLRDVSAYGASVAVLTAFLCRCRAPLSMLPIFSLFLLLLLHTPWLIRQLSAP